MFKAISDFLSGGGEDLSDEAREVITVLAELGQAKVDYYVEQIKNSLLNSGMDGDMTIPISAILNKATAVQAYSETGGDRDVSDLIGQIIGGEEGSTQKLVIKGVQTTLNFFLGQAVDSSGSIHSYYVVLEGISFVRIDMFSWYRNVTSSKVVMETFEKVVSTVLYKSVVDVTAIEFSTFAASYVKLLNDCGLTPEEIQAKLNQAHGIWELYKPQ